MKATKITTALSIIICMAQFKSCLSGDLDWLFIRHRYFVTHALDSCNLSILSFCVGGANGDCIG